MSGRKEVVIRIFSAIIRYDTVTYSSLNFVRLAACLYYVSIILRLRAIFRLIHTPKITIDWIL